MFSIWGDQKSAKGDRKNSQCAEEETWSPGCPGSQARKCSDKGVNNSDKCFRDRSIMRTEMSTEFNKVKVTGDLDTSNFSEVVREKNLQ